MGQASGQTTTTGQQRNMVGWFEIPVKDMDRMFADSEGNRIAVHSME